MDILSTLFVSLVLAIGFMSGVFVIGRRIKRFDIVDMAWGITIILVASGSMLYSLVQTSANFHWTKIVMLFVVVVWGARLAIHIGNRIIRTKKEDPRYVELRKKWQGDEERNIFFRIFVAQALLATIITLPVIIVNASEYVFVPAFVLAGLIIWMIGFLIEVIADLQLELHTTKNPGELMKSGLWRYSRHPNYFGELVQWWGIGLMGLSVDYGWIGLLGPLLLTFLILFISGIPPSEKRAQKRDGWDSYKRKTSVLVPLPPLKR